jgi:hypothetical protein
VVAGGNTIEVARVRITEAGRQVLAGTINLDVSRQPNDNSRSQRDTREHAWNWFALHATQRMQAFNFFVVATAFLIAAYASIIEKHPVAAAVLAAVGAWLTIWFNLLDARSRQLVEAGENALRVSQARLASLADNPQLEILDAVDKPRPRASSYRSVINVIQWTIFALFLLGAAFAIWLCRI